PPPWAAPSAAAVCQARARSGAVGFGRRPAVAVDRRLASFWFGTTLRPLHWTVPAVRDPVTGDYRCRDGWIRLHTNAAHHLSAALSTLNQPPDRDRVQRAVATWDADELEEAVLRAGGCAATLRSAEEWVVHPHGKAVAAEPLFHIDETEAGDVPHTSPNPNRPL